MSSCLKILFLVKERLVYGTKSSCYGLLNACEFIVNKLKEKGINAELKQVQDENGIDKIVHNKHYTHVFIEALWVTPSKFKILAKLHPNINWIVRIHSMIPFLVTEGMCFDWMNEYMELAQNDVKISLSCNNKKLLKDLNAIYRNVSYTPNIYNPSHIAEEYETKINKEQNILNIGCFGALRSLKNHAQQALWAIELANSKNKILNFHVNISEYETNESNPILKNLKAIFLNNKHNLVIHTWLSHPKFLYLVKQMDFGLQISLTETFCIVAADFINMRIPIIGSCEMKFIDSSCAVNPLEEGEVFNALNYVYDIKNKSNITSSNTKLLKNYNEISLNEWLKLLNSYINY